MLGKPLTLDVRPDGTIHAIVGNDFIALQDPATFEALRTLARQNADHWKTKVSYEPKPEPLIDLF